jgi:hypothetical protein
MSHQLSAVSSEKNEDSNDHPIRFHMRDFREETRLLERGAPSGSSPNRKLTAER